MTKQNETHEKSGNGRPQTWEKTGPTIARFGTVFCGGIPILGARKGVEWNMFPGFTTLQLVREVQELLSKMSIQPKDFAGRIIFMSMFKDISWGSKDNEQECESSAQLVSIYAKRFSPGRWSFLGPGSEEKWYSTHIDRPRGEWDRGPLSRGVLEKQRWWKIVNTLLR